MGWVAGREEGRIETETHGSIWWLELCFQCADSHPFPVCELIPPWVVERIYTYKSRETNFNIILYMVVLAGKAKKHPKTKKQDKTEHCHKSSLLGNYGLPWCGTGHTAKLAWCHVAHIGTSTSGPCHTYSLTLAETTLLVIEATGLWFFSESSGFRKTQEEHFGICGDQALSHLLAREPSLGFLLPLLPSHPHGHFRILLLQNWHAGGLCFNHTEISF